VPSEPAYETWSRQTWLLFAGIMILILGGLNVIWGLAAISRSRFFISEPKLVFEDLRSWGWIGLTIGAVQLVAGVGIFAQSQVARWVGVVIAAVNLIGALMSIDAYPLWALAIVGSDILVIYGLVVYGDRLRARA
jgi:hypothetical protein